MSTPSSKIGRDIDLHVARRLQAARKEAGISQEAAAAHIELTFQQVQKYERGKNRISAGKLAALAELYKKPIAWFFPDGKGNGPDLAAELLAAPHGADLARAYRQLDDDISRRAVTIVAEALALASNGAGHA